MLAYYLQWHLCERLGPLFKKDGNFLLYTEDTDAHKEKRVVIAIKYAEEKEYRYIIPNKRV